MHDAQETEAGVKAYTREGKGRSTGMLAGFTDIREWRREREMRCAHAGVRGSRRG